MSLSAEFRSDVALLEAHLQRSGAEQEHGLSSSKVTAVVTLAAIDHQRLCDFAGHGNLVQVEVTSDIDYAAKFRADAGTTFVADDASTAIEALRVVIDGDDDHQARAAIEAGRFAELAAALPSPTITIALTLRKPGAGPAFFWSTDALFAAADSWVGLAHFLALHPDLLLLDAGAMVITSPSLAIRGPDAMDLTPRSAASVLNRPPWRLASPAHFLPTNPSNTATDTTRIIEALSKLAVGVVWLRISVTAPTVTAGHDLGTAQIAFSHDPTERVNVGWTDLPHDAEADKAGKLWAWLDTDDDFAGGLEAVRQAASISVRSERDLRDGVDTVLRQGRFLYQLSRQRAVAAIVDARKAARLAAQSAAHTAAAEARTAARSTADRTVAAVIAALAVMITHQTDALSRSVSYLVLAAVLVGIVATLAHAFAFEFPATKTALKATLLDVRVTQRDVLLDEDIAEFESGAVIGDALGTLRLAKFVAGVAGACAVVAVVVGVLVVWVVAPQEGTPAPTSAPVPVGSTTSGTIPSLTSVAQSTSPSATPVASVTAAAPPTTSVVATSPATTGNP